MKRDRNARRTGGLLVLFGSVMVVLQGLEISSGQRATFIGLVPIAVSGVLLILTGLRLTLIPRGVTQGNISVIAAAAAILVVVTVLVIVSAGASKSTLVGRAVEW